MGRGRGVERRQAQEYACVTTAYTGNPVSHPGSPIPYNSSSLAVQKSGEG